MGGKSREENIIHIYNLCISTLIMKLDNLSDPWLLSGWIDAQSDPMAKIVCRVGSVHNRATHLIWQGLQLRISDTNKTCVPMRVGYALMNC